MSLKDVIEKTSLNSKDYNDFFSKDKIKTVEGRFELLALSILDVNRYNADRLWFKVAPELIKNGTLTKEHLNQANIIQIKDELFKAGYNRGENYTEEFASKLKRLSKEIENPPFNGDVSNVFYNFQHHNTETIKIIINELKKLPGIGQKVATMFVKIMLSDFEEWVWKGSENSLINIAPPVDSQVKKVFIRLGKEISGDFEKDLEKLSQEIGVSFIKIDDVFWNVGRIFCRSKINPNCHYCSLKYYCKYAEFRRNNEREKIQKLDKIVERYANA